MEVKPMFDMTWSSCATYASPCGELKEKLLKPLEIKMSENIDRATNLPPDAYEQSKKIYEEHCKIRDLHWKICNMDCKELERRLSEILADIDRLTGKFKQTRFQRSNTTIQTGPTKSGDPYEILKKEEKKKQEEQDKAQRYLDTVPVMMVALDGNGIVTLANKRACQVLGYEEQQVIGKNWFQLFVPERERDAVYTVFAQVASGEVKPYEYYENLIVNKRKKLNLC